MAQQTTQAHEVSVTAEAQRFRVLRAITLEDGRTAMPGEIIEASENWPYHRSRQMVEQGYLLPISPSTGEGGE